jgi:MFS family permease
MNCPHCNYDVYEYQDKCPGCGNNLNAQQQFYNMGSSSSTFSVEPEYPLSMIDAVMRPLKESDNLRKILIGGFISMIPIFGQIFISGYLVEYAGKIIHRKDSWSLSDFSDFMNTFIVGIMVFLANFIYGIVTLGISAITIAPFWGGLRLAIKSTENANSPAAIMAVVSAIIIPLLFIFLLFSLFALVMPIMTMLYARSRNFGDFFNFGAAFRLILGNFTDFVIASTVASLVVMINFSVVGIIGSVPLIGLILAPIGGSILWFGASLIIYSAYAEFFYKSYRDSGL